MQAGTQPLAGGACAGTVFVIMVSDEGAVWFERPGPGGGVFGDEVVSAQQHLISATTSH